MMSNIEVDQSGRMEVLTEDTALGFSNGYQASILIPASTKRKASRALRDRGVRPKMISIRMFAGGVFLLLKSHLNRISTVTIDTEYPGWEPEIKGLLLAHIRRQASDFANEDIVFGQIGKGSPAHDIAWRTYRGKRTADRKITAEELLKHC